MKTRFNTVDEYISSFPGYIQSVLGKIRQLVREAAPDAVEAISFQMPTFKLNGKNLVHFAAWKSHIGFYPVPSGDAALEEELLPYKQGRGSVQFPLDKPIPYHLMKKIVLIRVRETQKQNYKRQGALT